MIDAKRMREARGKATLMEVYRQTGVSRGLISRLETGERQSARSETLEALARYYGVSVGYLLGE